MGFIYGLILGIAIGWFTKVPFLLKAYRNKTNLEILYAAKQLKKAKRLKATRKKRIL